MNEQPDQQRDAATEDTRPLPDWTPPSGAAAGTPPGPAGPDARPGPAWPPVGPPPPPWAQPPGPPAGSGPPPGPRPRVRVSRWTWPAVVALALVVGLLGGGLGALVVASVTGDDATYDGRVPGGLDEVETRDEKPLPVKGGTVAAVAQEVLPSTVQILANAGPEGQATGSGFVLDGDGHVVTNNHVVAGADEEGAKIQVVDHLGRSYEATVVGRSQVYDLAVLQLQDAADLEPVALGSAEAMRVGEQVVAVGAPLGLSQTVTSGIVSALDRPVSAGAAKDVSYINAVQTDAAINPGNSGGPLVNMAGQVVGVNSAIATTGGGLGGAGGNIGVGFAIPVEQVRTTVDQILRTGEAQYPVIGAKVRVGGRPTFDGARITEVMDGTPAEDAGLQDDDVVLSVEGDRVSDGSALIVAIRTHRPGETIEMTIERGGERQQVEVTLDGQVG